jgi:hypothetical protein
MFKFKILWAFVLGVATSVLLLEAKTHFAYSPLGTRVFDALTAPGAHFVTAVNSPNALLSGWTKLWAALSFACNLLIYIFFWYACLWTVGYIRGRKNPYDRQNTLVPPLTR